MLRDNQTSVRRGPAMRLAAACIAAPLALGMIAPARAEDAVRVGYVFSLSMGGNNYALEKGYFKEQGVAVNYQQLDTSADAMALLGVGRFDIIEGGLSATYFSALAKNFPVTIIADRNSSPNNHKILVSAKLKDKVTTIKDLKGLRVATNSGKSTILAYSLGKVLASEGLSLKDVKLSSISFPQMIVGLTNGSVDAVIQISPLWKPILDAGVGFELADPDKVLQPQPFGTGMVFVNTDWAKKNPDVLKRYMIAYMRGVRQYCQAYHYGSNREDMINIIMKTGVETRLDLLRDMPWVSRNPLGTPNVSSIDDVQKFFNQEGVVPRTFPPERLADTQWVDYANSKLGPFTVENASDRQDGCR